jgi:hypothetical protein
MSIDNGPIRPRLVVNYGGLQIYDARDRIQIVIDGAPPRGLAGSLHVEGFRRLNASTWDAPANPMNIATAQAIGAAFFTTDQ